MPTPADSGGSDRSLWERFGDMRRSESYKSTTLFVSVLFLAVIVVLAGAVAVSSKDTDHAAPGIPSESGVPTAQPAPPAPEELPADAFGIPTTDQHGRRVETPTNPLGQVLPQTGPSSPSTAPADGSVPAPAGLMWQRVNGMPLPFSTSDGPTSISADGVPGGFSHTPQGALLAAWQIGQRAAWAPDNQAQAVITQRAVVGPAAAAVADRMNHNDAQLQQLRPQLPARMFDTPIAVKVENYDADYAHVQFASPNDPDVFSPIAATVPFDMVWRDGTWKWVVPNDGTNPGTPIDNLAGWSRW